MLLEKSMKVGKEDLEKGFYKSPKRGGEMGF